MPLSPLDIEFWQTETETLFNIVYPKAERVLLEAVEDGFDLLEISGGVNWNLVNERVQQYASQYTFDLVTNINDTSRGMLQTRLDDWIGSGDPLDVLIDQLAPWFGPVRGEMIGVTEITRMYAEGNLYAWRDSELVTDVRWMTVADPDTVCAICKALHGTTAAIDTLIFPTYQGLPPAHVRCRCWILPVVNVNAWFARWRYRDAFDKGTYTKLPRFIVEQLAA